MQIVYALRSGYMRVGYDAYCYVGKAEASYENFSWQGNLANAKVYKSKAYAKRRLRELSRLSCHEIKLVDVAVHPTVLGNYTYTDLTTGYIFEKDQTPSKLCDHNCVSPRYLYRFVLLTEKQIREVADMLPGSISDGIFISILECDYRMVKLAAGLVSGNQDEYVDEITGSRLVSSFN